MECISSTGLVPLGALVCAWGSALNVALSAPQALGLLAEVEGKRFGRRVPELLPLMLALLQAHIAAVNADDGEVGEPGTTQVARGWQLTYAALLLLEKTLKQVQHLQVAQGTFKIPAMQNVL